MKKAILTVCGFLGASALVGCSPTQSHTHNFVKSHDEHSHFEICECGEKQNVVDHVFVDSHEDANCQHGQLTIHTCECGYTFNEESGSPVHNYEKVSTEVVDIGHSLDHYECSLCHDHKTIEVDETAITHNFVMEITKVATCQEKGTKKFTCTDDGCGYSFEEEYSDYNAHRWAVASEENGLTKYHCENTGCIETKEVISHKQETSAKVEMTDLEKAGTVELKEASISFDSTTLSELDSNVTIGAEKKEASEISEIVSEETKELLKDAPVFDFTLKGTDDEEIHEFAGKVTVEVPYTLKENEDPDNIGVLYINENGATENMPAKYSNGSVSFETTHFSYYAVIEMTKEEACDLLGHNYYIYNTAGSTCTKNGYIHKICRRCGNHDYETLPLEEHHYHLVTSVPSSTTEHGYNEYKCDNCENSYRTELPLAPEAGDSFLLAFIKSALAENIKISGSAIPAERGTEEKIDVAMNLGDNPFIYSNAGGNASIIDGGYSYNGFSRYKDDTLAEIKLIKNTINSLPSDVGDALVYVEKILDKLGLVKNEVDGLINVTLDKDVLRATYEVLKTGTIEEIFNYFFGEDSLNEVVSLVVSLFDGTISDVVDLLKSIGLDPEALFPIIKSLPIEIPFKSIDELLTPEVLSMKVADLLAQALPIQITSEQIVALVNQYKGKTLIELIEEMEQVDVEPMMDLIDEIVEKYIEDAELKIITTLGGQLISAEFTGTVYDISREGYWGGYEQPMPYPDHDHIDSNNDGICDICMAIIDPSKLPEPTYEIEKLGTVNFKLDTTADLSSYKDLINEKIKVVNQIEEDYKITEDHNIYKDALEEFFGLSFRIEQDEYEDLYFVSETTQLEKFCDLNDLYNYYGDDKPTSLSGSLAIPFDPYYAENHHFYSSDLITKDQTNYNVCTHFLNDGDMYLLDTSYAYGYYVEFLVENSDVTYSFSNILRDNFTLLYDVNNRKLTFIENSKCVHNQSYEKISFKEFQELAHWWPSNPEGYSFYKIKCSGCNYVTYDYYPKGFEPSGSSAYFTHEKLNDEAKQYQILWSGNYVVVKNLYKFSNTKYISNTARNEFRGGTFSFGNLDIVFTYTRDAEKTCNVTELIEFKIDGEVVKSKESKIHDIKYGEEVFQKAYTEGCYGYELYYRYCEGCGEKIGEYNRIVNEYHQYELAEKVDPTETIRGIEIYECKDCHTYYSNTLHPTHQIDFDDELGKYVCEGCGMTWDNYPENHYVIEDITEYSDRINFYYGDKEDYYFYSIANIGHSYNLYNDKYELVIAAVDDEGNINFDYIDDLGFSTIDSLPYCLSERHGYWFNIDGIALPKEEVEAFKANMPEGYHFEVVAIKFTRPEEVVLEEINNLIYTAADSFGIDHSEIVDASEEGCADFYIEIIHEDEMYNYGYGILDNMMSCFDPQNYGYVLTNNVWDKDVVYCLFTNEYNDVIIQLAAYESGVYDEETGKYVYGMYVEVLQNFAD